MNSVLVFGWYGHENVGDELFKDAFRELFPNVDFKFTDCISIADLRGIDTVIFGGGSFVYAEPNISAGALELIKGKQIFYIGIGVEEAISKPHQELMKLADLIVTRSENALEKLKALNPNSIFAPDIVLALKNNVHLAPKRKDKSVLIFPNIELVPKAQDPNWKHLAWEYFKSEFSQFLDVLVDHGHQVEFLRMCDNENQNDDWAAIEVINKMANRNSKYLSIQKPISIEALSLKVSSFQKVITQRYHGIILAEITETPYLAIHHHDKLKEAYPGNGAYLPYYAMSKQELLYKFANLPNKFEFDNDFNERFDILKDKVSFI